MSSWRAVAARAVVSVDVRAGRTTRQLLSRCLGGNMGVE